ncbi:LPXTG cell wall anchor domain-containing protein [Micromonospora sp. NPDC049679]|uniref:LPXTG cell wall anchor domain-containing protein n=1 Tax=Micromonospora sp. NPDC049679 TaxID=3155920 RepID=UPI0033FCD17A
MAGLTTAGVVGALVTPALAVGPAAAASPCTQPASYGALASADLVKLGLLDLHPLGLGLGPVANVRIASASSGLSGEGTVHSEAGARQIDANLLGVELPLGPLSQTVYQQAPPAHAHPATANALERDLGVLSLGVGDLKAHATWIDGMECGQESGDATMSSSTIADLSVLPGPGGQALVRLPSNLTSSTATGLTSRNDVVSSVATASIGLAEIRLFAGSPSQVTVKVIKPPKLTVSTAGSRASATVEYTSPVLEISGPNIPTQRLDAPGKTIDLALPTSLAGAAEARSLARTEKLPLLGGNPLDQVIKGLSPNEVAGARSKATSNAPLPLPNLPKLPLLPELAPAGQAIGGAAAAPAEGELSIVRLSLGELEKQITDQAVRAQAASLRLQVITAGENAGSDTDSASVVDLGVGLLDAAAVAPLDEGGGVSDEEPGDEEPGDEEAGDEEAGGAGGGLPVTGANITVFAGIGLLLAVGGGALVFFTRRRRLSWRA